MGFCKQTIYIFVIHTVTYFKDTVLASAVFEALIPIFFSGGPLQNKYKLFQGIPDGWLVFLKLMKV